MRLNNLTNVLDRNQTFDNFIETSDYEEQKQMIYRMAEERELCLEEDMVCDMVKDFWMGFSELKLRMDDLRC